MEVKKVKLKINDIHPSPKNPFSGIKDEDYKILVKSISDFPEMLELREIIVDENNEIICGEKRWRACKDNKYKTIEVKKVIGLTQEKKDELMIKDNINKGLWDYDKLANEWNQDKIQEWGIPGIPWTRENEDEGKELDIDSFKDTMILKIELKEDDYHKAIEILRGIHEDLGKSLMEILNDRKI